MDTQSICDTLLRKLFAAWNVPSGQVVTWRQFITQLSPFAETKEVMLARLDAQFGAGNVSDAEKEIVLGLKDRQYLAQLDALPVNCQLLTQILDVNPDGGSDEEGASSSDDEDSDDEEEVAVATASQPGAVDMLPPAPIFGGGGFGAPAGPTGAGPSMTDIFGASAPQPFIQPAQQPIFPGGATAQPNPFGAPAPFGGTIAPPANPSPFGGPSVFGGPTQPQPNPFGAPPAVQDVDLPYVMAVVSSIKPSETSRFYLLEIPEEDGNVIKISLFLTSGALPTRVNHTFFSNDDFDKGDNPQKKIIHEQNKAKVKAAKSPSDLFTLSDGTSPDGIAASKAILLESKITKSVPLEVAGKPSKPKSNRSAAPSAAGVFGGPTSGPFGGFGGPMSGPTQPIANFGTVATAPVSGPVSGSIGLPMNFATGQPMPPPEGSQVVKVLDMQGDKKNKMPNAAPSIDMYWLPGGPRPFGVDTSGANKYNWFIKADGVVVKSDQKVLTAGQAATLKGPAANAKVQLAAIDTGKRIYGQVFAQNPNWYQPFGVASAFPSQAAQNLPNIFPTAPVQQQQLPSAQSFFGMAPAATATQGNVFGAAPAQPSVFGMAQQITGSFPVQGQAAPSNGNFFGNPPGQNGLPAAQPSIFGNGFGAPTVPVATAAAPALQGSGGAAVPSVFGTISAQPQQSAFSFLSQLPSANQ